MKRAIMAAVALSISACASNPEKIQTAYVSPMQYKDYDCDQIGGELTRVTRRANELHGNLKQEADADNAQMAVGMLLFWPALFFLEGGDGPQAAEYAQLKGERDALEQVAVMKKCDASIIPPRTAPAPAESKIPDGT